MKYSNCFAWSKARVGSDHTPLILDTGDKGVPRPKYFYFEEKWLHQEDFHALVQDKWSELRNKFPNGAYSLDIWHGCLQGLRQYLRGGI